MNTPRLIRTATAVVSAGLVLGVGLAALPKPPTLSDTITGDRALAAAVEDTVRDAGNLDRVVIASVAPDGQRLAGFGADADTVFEIGSLTKTMTAAMFQDAIDRGELTPDTRLGELLPLGESPAAGVLLGDLATHTSGLPRLLTDPTSTVDALLLTSRHTNPYRLNVDELIAGAQLEELTNPGEYAYSNLGTSLLGEAVARNAGLSYPELLRERLFAPLGMRDSVVVVTDADAGEQPTTGWNPNGIAEAAWSIGGYAPAGGVRSTLADMSRYVRALLDGTAPGITALDPHLARAEGAPGSGWSFLEDDEVGTTLTLHNGQTGGFTGFIILDRAAGRGGLILSNTAVQSPDVAYLLATEPDTAPGTDPHTPTTQNGTP